MAIDGITNGPATSRPASPPAQRKVEPEEAKKPEKKEDVSQADSSSADTQPVTKPDPDVREVVA